ncbi:odorant receptor 82a-like [Osmia bicornis bicornis]|uniref:odorant receptor 82a-like n=1 Tax=Osmia bicornis bicornis TaxID=1437191 RepID=UPI001EAF6E5E|nr:odorant receptor 82a-like [Osmia bicornis bicornis]
MKKVARKSIDYYILPNKILCSVVGISLAERKYTTSGKIFAYSHLIVVIAAAGSMFVPQIMLVAVNWGDLKILTGVGCVITTVGQYIFKLIYVVARRERAKRLYKELRSLWDSADDPEEMKSYEQFAYWGRICTLLVYTIGLCTIIIYTITAAVDYFIIDYTDNNNDKTRYLPFEVWYGTDVTESPKFEVAFVCQFVAAMMSCTGLWAIETSCMTTLLHVSGQFKLINTWISSIGIKSDCEPTDHCRNYLPNVEANLIKCIRHHQRVINVADEVSNLLTPIIFMQILTSGIEICLSVFGVIENDTSAEFLKSTIYLTAITSQLFLWCYSGEILIQESEEIANIAYLNVPWYNLPPIHRRQLLLIILRAQKCCSISGLTFQRLSFHTLTNVFGFRYSIQQPLILLCCEKCKRRECQYNDYSNL